ncbi:hypothetical protein H310_05675 [Aphanomyces invadans]|uniref:Dolichyl-diphosphooligosaccharide--protein glycosyltransferase subunit OST2 n=1 Tax=Aphanomyces invadans TaxID=157072 RepID=A0A024U8Y1_9STRA|nr:hypothetical protein H310_05675 [Aphanomyces invadans]ETW02063.1 hypothetical protein H310_05675 [Aphanomyces invadans]|eukprot:XP_008868668.1 hypothetical protein H310_05675 [Aphanomyces invadans]
MAKAKSAKAAAAPSPSPDKSIVAELWSQYNKNSTRKMKLIDGFLAYVLATGVLQFVYCVVFGTYPFNSFLSGFLATVGVFVFAVSLRMQINPLNVDAFAANPRTPERAFADFLFCSLLLFLVVVNFMG